MKPRQDRRRSAPRLKRRDLTISAPNFECALAEQHPRVHLGLVVVLEYPKRWRLRRFSGVIQLVDSVFRHQADSPGVRLRETSPYAPNPKPADLFRDLLGQRREGKPQSRRLEKHGLFGGVVLTQRCFQTSRRSTRQYLPSHRPARIDVGQSGCEKATCRNPQTNFEPRAARDTRGALFASRAGSIASSAFSRFQARQQHVPCPAPVCHFCEKRKGNTVLSVCRLCRRNNCRSIQYASSTWRIISTSELV